VIARYLAELAARTPGSLRFLERMVNGQPGLVAQLDGVTGAVYAFDIADDKITHIWAMLNPEKLRTGRRANPAPRIERPLARWE
jgi:hypothetical protein